MQIEEKNDLCEMKWDGVKWYASVQLSLGPILGNSQAVNFDRTLKYHVSLYYYYIWVLKWKYSFETWEIL